MKGRCHLRPVRLPLSAQAVATLAVSEATALLPAGVETHMVKLRHPLVLSVHSELTQNTHVGFELTEPLPVGVDPTATEHSRLLKALSLPSAPVAITYVVFEPTTQSLAGGTTSMGRQLHLESSSCAAKALGKLK